MSFQISQLARRIIGQYDHNRNGQIDRRNAWPDESERQERYFSGNQTIVSTYSRDRLVRAADTNRDGRVNQWELEAVMRQFDRDRDGKLDDRGGPFGPRSEYDRFEEAYGERLVGQSVVTNPNPPFVPIPIPFPVPFPHKQKDNHGRKH